MSAEEISKSALKCFSIHGYEGTSLSMITEELGMKKQSVYAHYKGKDDIFMSVLDKALEEEVGFLREYFSREYDSAAECFDSFLTKIRERFASEKENNIKFILHTSYMPPEKLKEEVSAKCHIYFEMIEKMVYSVVSGFLGDKFETRARVLAITTLIAGLFSEIPYCRIDLQHPNQRAGYALYTKTADEKLERRDDTKWKGI
jgi:AcrR family transcriptional regulator